MSAGESPENDENATASAAKRKRRRLYQTEESAPVDADESAAAAVPVPDEPVTDEPVTDEPVPDEPVPDQPVPAAAEQAAAAPAAAPPAQRAILRRIPAVNEPADLSSLHRQAQSIIDHHALIAAGVSALPVPFLDLAAAVSAQTLLVRALARLHGLPDHEPGARALVFGLTGGTATVLFGRLARSALRLIPGIGAALGFLVVPGSVAAFTGAVGLAFHAYFLAGGSLVHPDPSQLRWHFDRVPPR